MLIDRLLERSVSINDAFWGRSEAEFKSRVAWMTFQRVRLAIGFYGLKVRYTARRRAVWTYLVTRCERVSAILHNKYSGPGGKRYKIIVSYLFSKNIDLFQFLTQRFILALEADRLALKRHNSLESVGYDLLCIVNFCKRYGVDSCPARHAKQAVGVIHTD